jgi:hypothetical protein
MTDSSWQCQRHLQGCACACLYSIRSSLQAVLYGYYILSAMGLRAMSPAMALMTSQEAHLSGSFRSAHQVQLIMGSV